MAWGPNAVVVEAKSQEKRAEIAQVLGSFGLKPIDDENDAYAGILTMSR